MTWKQPMLKVSTYDIAAEVRFGYGGMLMVVEPEDWRGQEDWSAEQLSAALLDMAKKLRPTTVHKHPRGAKKKVEKGYVPGRWRANTYEGDGHRP